MVLVLVWYMACFVACLFVFNLIDWCFKDICLCVLVWTLWVVVYTWFVCLFSWWLVVGCSLWFVCVVCLFVIDWLFKCCLWNVDCDWFVGWVGIVLRFWFGWRCWYWFVDGGFAFVVVCCLGVLLAVWF